jgi:hypothetical protein
MLPLRRDLVFGRDRVDRARFDAVVAVDALLGVHVEHLAASEPGSSRGWVDAIHRADLDALGVLGPDAWFADHVRHRPPARAFPSSLGKPSGSQHFSGLAV